MPSSRIVGFFLLFLSNFVFAQKDVYLFSYFVDNGQDGLHFAYSKDGPKWESINDGKSFLKPEIGKDKLVLFISISKIKKNILKSNL